MFWVIFTRLDVPFGPYLLDVPLGLVHWRASHIVGFYSLKIIKGVEIKGLGTKRRDLGLFFLLLFGFLFPLP